MHNPDICVVDLSAYAGVCKFLSRERNGVWIIHTGSEKIVLYLALISH